MSNGLTRVIGPVVLMEDILGYLSLADYTAQNVDCTVILQSLLATGNPVFIPPGVYLISGLVIPPGAILLGAGVKSVLKQKDGSSVVGMTVGSGATLQNFKVDGNKMNQLGTSHTIQMSAVTEVVVDSLVISDSRNDGLVALGCNKLRLKNINVYGYAGNGIRVLSGTGITIDTPLIHDSDALAIGHGLVVASAFNETINNVNINAPTCRNNTGRGISITAAGTGLDGVSLISPMCISNVREGIYLATAQDVVIHGGIVAGNGIDGLAVTADSQFNRIIGLVARNNVGYGIRELTVNSTPNNNGFIYCLSRGNGTDAITKLGAQSFVI